MGQIFAYANEQGRVYAVDAEGKDGVWRTVRGRKVFIREGEALGTALDRSLKGKTANTAAHVVVDKNGHGVFDEKTNSYAGVTDSEWEDWAHYSEEINTADSLVPGHMSSMGEKVDASDIAEFKAIQSKIQAAAEANFSVGNFAMFRGESFDTLAEAKAIYKHNALITLDRLTGVTNDLSIATQYASGGGGAPGMLLNEGRTKVLLAFQQRGGIQGIQTAPLGVPSNELIMPKGAQFRVVGVRPAGKNSLVVELYNKNEPKGQRVVDKFAKPDTYRGLPGLVAHAGKQADFSIHILATADAEGRVTPSTLRQDAHSRVLQPKGVVGPILALADAAGHVYVEWDESKHPRDQDGKWTEAPTGRTYLLPTGLFSETPTDAVHYGDGGIAHDTVRENMSGQRSTGHFGTGIYFLSNQVGAYQPTEQVGITRPVKYLDLKGLKLAHGDDQLHRGLKIINTLARTGTKADLDFGKITSAGHQAAFLVGLSTGVYNLDSVRGNALKRSIRSVVEEERNGLVPKNELRSASTRVMQALGYDGVDSRGTSLDNSDYGSVVYAMPPPRRSRNLSQWDESKQIRNEKGHFQGIRHPLYVSRPVLNADEIIAWAKSVGFTTTLPAEDMHVTVCYSREPVDWLALEHYDDTLEVPPEGVRTLVWDESKHVRGKTTPGSRGGSFAPGPSYHGTAEAIAERISKEGLKVGGSGFVFSTTDKPMAIGYAASRAREYWEVRSKKPIPSGFKLALVVLKKDAPLELHPGARVYPPANTDYRISKSRVDKKHISRIELYDYHQVVAASIDMDSDVSKLKPISIKKFVLGEGEFYYPLPPEDMYLDDTQFYADRTLTNLGDDGAVVLQFDSVPLQARHQYFSDQGASWDYDADHSHITLTYTAPDGLDLSTIEPYTGKIVLGPEQFAELETGWAEDIKEQAQEDENGVWRTVRGRHVFIREGEDIKDAMSRSLAGTQPFEEVKKEIFENYGVSINGDQIKDPVIASHVSVQIGKALNGLYASSPAVEDAIRHSAYGAGGMKVVLYPGKMVFNEEHGKPAIAFYNRKTNTMSIASGLQVNLNVVTKSKVGTGFSVGQDFHSIFAHELGHGVSGRLAVLASQKGVLVGKELYDSKPKAYWQKTVSFYAGTNHKELMAEAFSSYTHPRYSEGKSLPPELVKVFEAAGVKSGTRKYKQQDHVDQLSPIEIDYAQIKNDLDAMEAKFRDELREVLAQSRNATLATVKRNRGELPKDFKLPYTTDIQGVIKSALQRAMDRGEADASKEIGQARRLVKGYAEEDGVWRTVRGRKVFIREGEDFDAALKRSLGGVTNLEKIAKGSSTGLYYAHKYEAEQSTPRDKWSPNQVEIESALLDGAPIKYIATDSSGKIVGAISYGKNDEHVDITITHIGSMQKGVGTTLMRKAQRSAIQTKSKLTLESSAIAPGFYEHLGFKNTTAHIWEWDPKTSHKFEQHDYAKAPTFTPKAALKWLRAKIFWVTDVLTSGLLEDIRLAIINGLKTGKPTDSIVTDIAQVYIPYLGDPTAVKDGELPTAARLETVVRTNLVESYNQGRIATFVKPDMMPFLDGIRYSAILDSRTTPVCQFLHDKIFKPDEIQATGLVPSNHFNCRSLVVPLVVGEISKPPDFKVDPKVYITPAEIEYARSLADAKFLEQDDVHEFYDPDQPRVPKGSEDGGQFTSTGVGQHFKDAPLDGKGAAKWRKKMQTVYDSDPEFRAATDATMLFTQGEYSSVRAMAIQEITGELPERYKDSYLPTWRDKKMFGSPLSTYKEYFEGQSFIGDKDSPATWGEAARAVNNAIRSSAPLGAPIYRGVYGRDNMEKLLAMKPGETFDVVGPTSFTADPVIAEKFSVNKASGQSKGGLGRGVTSAVIEVEKGSRGIAVSALSPWNQKEVISSGRFRIKSITEGPEVATGKSRGWTTHTTVHHIVVEQVDTFRNTKK